MFTIINYKMNNYTDAEYEIFSRLFILKDFTEDNIRVLSELKIGVVGIGGIGCPLSQYLISSGIKELTLIDGDIVEKSNLNRQILFNLNDIGEKKVKVAKDKLQNINNDCKINIIDTNLDLKNINVLSNCSVIVDATDNWNTSKLINEYCVKNSICFLYSSVIGHDLQIALFENKKGNDHICLSCLFPNKKDVDLPRCETVGISGISAGLAGLMTAQKLINYSLKIADETNKLTISDAKKLSIENIVVKSKHDCDLNKI